MKLSLTDSILFCTQVNETLKERPYLRTGQTMFNTLLGRHPRLAEQIRTTPLDPFFQDNRIPYFLQEIMDEKSLYYVRNKKLLSSECFLQ